jgi:hypothetical protein
MFYIGRGIRLLDLERCVRSVKGLNGTQYHYVKQKVFHKKFVKSCKKQTKISLAHY